MGYPHIALCRAVVILIPSAAFAASCLTDDIFGSSATIEQHNGAQEEYQEVEGMLQVAKGKLTEDSKLTPYFEKINGTAKSQENEAGIHPF